MNRPWTRSQALVARRAARFYRGQRRLNMLSRVAARRALVGRALTGGALAAGALAGYGAYRGIKRIRAARARARKRRNVGFAMKRLQVRTRQILDTDRTLLATRTLYFNAITDLVKGTAQNERSSDCVNFKGWKIQAIWEPIVPDNVQVCMAVVCPKSNNVPNTAEWFRGYDADRADDFSTSRTALKQMMVPINADKYEILWRWNFMVSGLGSSTLDKATGRRSKIINKYCKLNRQLRYESSAVSTEEDACYLVYWLDLFNNAAAAPVVAGRIAATIRIIGYFRDAKD